MPTTAQPTPRQFADAFARLAEEGAQEIIAISVSGKMSGTLNSIRVAAEHAPVRVHAWDSYNASMGAGWQVIAAAEMARTGEDAAAILQKLGEIRGRMLTVATPATLRYLMASGRAPRLQGSIGEILDVKPLLAIVDGILEPIGRARGRRRALAEALAHIAAATGDSPVRVAVTHANAAAEGAQLMDSAKERLNAVETVITDLGPVLATLAGPGIIALCVYTI